MMLRNEEFLGLYMLSQSFCFGVIMGFGEFEGLPGLNNMTQEGGHSSGDESLSGGALPKRGTSLNYDDDDAARKKSRLNVSVTECEADNGENHDSDQSGSGRTTLMQPQVLDDQGKQPMGGQILGTDHSHLDKAPPMPKMSVIEADAAEDKGSRHTMEDAWVVLPDASLDYEGPLRCAHFAIYDGHGGRLAAEYAQKHLHANVLSAGFPRELMDVKAAKKAILEGFRKTDESLLQESVTGGWQDGATAVCIWVLGQTVLIANVGDAKAVAARSSAVNGDETTSLKAIVLTREHKAIYPQERARIQKAGGSVGFNGRLQGRLEVSRAFGDRQFKKVGVIATPDVHSFELTDREHFIILGCDGLWGVFGPADAVEFIDKQLKGGASATVASRRLIKEAVRERRCKDNCTAIVIIFKHV